MVSTCSIARAGTFTVYRPKTGDPTSLSNSIILSLYEDQEGILWIGTFGGGVNKFDRDATNFPSYSMIQTIPRISALLA